MPTVEEILNETRRRNEEIAREANRKVREMNEAVYRDCEALYHSIQEDQIRCDAERELIKEQGRQDREDLERETKQAIAEIEYNTKEFKDQQHAEIQLVETQVSNFKDKEKQETSSVTKLEEQKLSQLRQSNQIRLEQKVASDAEELKRFNEKQDQIFAEELQKIENEEFEREGNDEIARAQSRLQLVLEEERLCQEKIQRDAAEERQKWSWMPSFSMPSFLKSNKSSKTAQEKYSNGGKEKKDEFGGHSSIKDDDEVD